MGLFDELKQRITSGLGFPADAPEAAAAAEHPNLLAGVVEMLEKRGVSSLVEEFKSKGLGDVVSSWVGNGANLPISAEKLRSVIGPEQIEAIAQRAGLPEGEATALLAKILPGLVDKLTPQGAIEPASETP